jgi:serine/threonine protein kinase
LSKDRHRHSHLVTLLASYEQKQTFSLIFPLATHDLFGFWEAESYPRKTDSIARWIAEQCKGLAEGLSRIHRWQTFSGSSVISEEDAEYSETTPADDLASQDDTSPIDRTPRNYFGVHGDLKPENILWYPDPSRRGHGTLKITDFGIARFSKNYSRPGVMPNSPSYRSPEFEVLESHSPACDVWALGCTYLEFVTWFCGGQRALDEFGKQRLEHDEKFGEIKSDKFFAIYYSPEEPGVKQAKVKNSVATVSETRDSLRSCVS